MSFKHINFKQLRVFLAVVEWGSFSAAAKSLYLSQSVVSRHIAVLEGTLNSTLLNRGSRGVEATEAGQILASYAQRIFALEEEANIALNELHDIRSGRVRIGASMTIGNYLLPRILAIYHERYPQVEITLAIANTEVIQHDLRERNIDVGLTEGFVDDEAFTVRVFATDELVIVAAPDSPITNMESPALHDLAGMPCVIRDKGSGTRAVIEQNLAERNIKLNYAMSLGSTEAVKQAVIAGAGFTIISRHAVVNELRTAQLARVWPQDFALQRPLHLLQLKNWSSTRAVDAFIEVMSKQEDNTKLP